MNAAGKVLRPFRFGKALKSFCTIALMANARAFLIFTGTELVRGRLNSYTPLICAELEKLGVSVCGETTLPDYENAVARAIKTALGLADIVLVTGGLGPTFDDITRQAAARAVGEKLVLSPELLRGLKVRFAKLRREMPPTNARQALLIRGARALPNPAGTAPGQALRLGGKLLLLQPGPLAEWRPMFKRYIAPEIKRAFRLRGAPPRVDISIGDTAESAAAEALAPVMERFPDAEYTILASPGTVRFLAAPGGKTPAKAAAQIRRMCRAALGGAVFGEGGATLSGALGAALEKRGQTLALAESCTGGLAASMITDRPGSSRYFPGGIVAYSNEAKIKFLGVRRATIKKHGAVSAQCALEMAAGARAAFGADWGLAITGIAGPGGGTRQKPVGLVYIAAAGPGGKSAAQERRFCSSRENNKLYSAAAALNLLRKMINS